MKILFMEDELTIREVLTEYMKTSGYIVDGVSDGEEALIKLNENIYNIAILDIMVPKINGLDVLREIRRKNLNIGIIMLTALEDEKSQIDSFNEFADDYVIKPVSPIILLKRIETLARRIKYDYNPNVNKKGLFIDKDAYKIYYNEKNIKLTLSEFLLLEALSTNPNKVFTREELIFKIFNEEYFGNDRIIDAHIKNIRKKLPYNFIKTIIGVGYRFEGDDYEN